MANKQHVLLLLHCLAVTSALSSACANRSKKEDVRSDAAHGSGDTAVIADPLAPEATPSTPVVSGGARIEVRNTYPNIAPEMLRTGSLRDCGLSMPAEWAIDGAWGVENSAVLFVPKQVGTAASPDAPSTLLRVTNCEVSPRLKVMPVGATLSIEHTSQSPVDVHVSRIPMSWREGDLRRSVRAKTASIVSEGRLINRGEQFDVQVGETGIYFVSADESGKHQRRPQAVVLVVEAEVAATAMFTQADGTAARRTRAGDYRVWAWHSTAEGAVGVGRDVSAVESTTEVVNVAFEK